MKRLSRKPSLAAAMTDRFWAYWPLYLYVTHLSVMSAVCVYFFKKPHVLVLARQQGVERWEMVSNWVSSFWRLDFLAALA